VVSPLLVKRPRSAVGRSLGCAVFPGRARPDTVKAPGHPLFELASLQSLTQQHLASPPQQASSPHGLLLPSAHSGSKVHSRGRCLCPLRSAFRVWLPSWRLSPFGPLPVLFRTGGAHGIRPSELPPPARSPRCRHREAPTYRFARRCFGRGDDRPARQAAVSGLCPLRASLTTKRSVSTPAAGCSPGLPPSEALSREP
jgi:hypothetical protein